MDKSQIILALAIGVGIAIIMIAIRLYNKKHNQHVTKEDYLKRQFNSKNKDG